MTTIVNKDLGGPPAAQAAAHTKGNKGGGAET